MSLNPIFYCRQLARSYLEDALNREIARGWTPDTQRAFIAAIDLYATKQRTQ